MPQELEEPESAPWELRELEGIGTGGVGLDVGVTVQDGTGFSAA